MKVWIVAEDNITEMGKTLTTPQFGPLFMASKMIKVDSFERLPYWILLTFEDFETRHC